MPQSGPSWQKRGIVGASRAMSPGPRLCIPPILHSLHKPQHIAMPLHRVACSARGPTVCHCGFRGWLLPSIVICFRHSRNDSLLS